MNAKTFWSDRVMGAFAGIAVSSAVMAAFGFQFVKMAADLLAGDV